MAPQSENTYSDAYLQGYNVIREEMYQRGIIRERSGFVVTPDRQAYIDFLAGVKASR